MAKDLSVSVHELVGNSDLIRQIRSFATWMIAAPGVNRRCGSAGTGSRGAIHAKGSKLASTPT